MKQALIIDDNPLNLELLTRLLKREEFESIRLQDPMEITTMIDQLGGVHVVFVDIQMPNLDGYQVFSILQRHINPQTPIIACTAFHDELAEARKIGFNGFVGKPLNIDRFPNQLGRILKGEPVWEI